MLVDLAVVDSHLRLGIHEGAEGRERNVRRVFPHHRTAVAQIHWRHTLGDTVMTRNRSEGTEQGNGTRREDAGEKPGTGPCAREKLRRLFSTEVDGLEEVNRNIGETAQKVVDLEDPVGEVDLLSPLTCLSDLFQEFFICLHLCLFIVTYLGD